MIRVKTKNTLPETNIAPEIGPSQKEIRLRTIHFQGRAVSFREGNPGNHHIHNEWDASICLATMLGKSSKNTLENGGEKLWFDMV